MVICVISLTLVCDLLNLIASHIPPMLSLSPPQLGCTRGGLIPYERGTFEFPFLGCVEWGTSVHLSGLSSVVRWYHQRFCARRACFGQDARPRSRGEGCAGAALGKQLCRVSRACRHRDRGDIADFALAPSVLKYTRRQQHPLPFWLKHNFLLYHTFLLSPHIGKAISETSYRNIRIGSNTSRGNPLQKTPCREIRIRKTSNIRVGEFFFGKTYRMAPCRETRIQKT